MTVASLAISAPVAMPPLAELYARHFRLIWWVVRGAGVPDEAIEDVVHDVFVALHRRRGSYDGEQPLERWLVGVARNAAFSHRRSTARRRLRVLAIEPPEPVAPIDEQLAQQRAWIELRSFLDGLDADQREVFTLIELHGASAPEVAGVLDVKLNTVYARLRLARAKLERWLARRGAADRLPRWLGAAANGGRPPASTRERTWMAIAASTRVSTLPASSVLASGWIRLVVPAVIAATIGGVIVARSDVSADAGGGRAGGFEEREPVVAAVDREPAVEVVPRHEVVDREPVRDEAAARASADRELVVHASIAAQMPDASRRSTEAPGVRGPTSVARSDVPADGAPAVGDGAAVAAAPPVHRPRAVSPEASRSSDDEVRWLDRADAALARADAHDALAWLDRHAVAFHETALAPERALLRVRALCELGRVDAARDAAAPWLARRDLPRIVAGLRRSCVER